MQRGVGPHPANRLLLSVHSDGIPAGSKNAFGAAFDGLSKDRICQELRVPDHGVSNLVDTPQGGIVGSTSAKAERTKIIAKAPGYVGRYEDAMPIDALDTLPVRPEAVIQGVKLRADALHFTNHNYSWE
jgi:hypothetical protein